MSKLRAGILGGAGYTGGELARLLLGHPEIELAAASSASHAGRPLTAAHPHLRGATPLEFARDLDPEGLDVLFAAGAHGTAMERLPEILSRRPELRVIDLSADFRLRDVSRYPAVYGRDHSAPELLGGFIYGLPELDGDSVRGARRVANPGCFATAISLALGPLARAGVSGEAKVAAVTGSSGSGASPSAAAHHPSRDGNLRAYKPLAHQHAPEVEQLFDRLAGKPSMRVALVPVSGPFVRGIYAVCQVDLPEDWGAERVAETLSTAYAGKPFVRLLTEPPELKAVVGTNFCDIHAVAQGRRLAVTAALDNLVKGAAGQAVQNMNLMLGLSETAGLGALGVYP